ncbi:unnamed protein product [Effrenium voratum]|nr:unnamed protein product [Effrenium voratum]
MGSLARRRPAPMAVLLLAAAAAEAAEPTLLPPRWQRLATGQVRPEGWLRKQMQLQAEALTSHLPLFWPNIANTSWLGGNSDVDGGLHENTPYWLNGAVPLALQLQDTNLLALVESYMNGIITRQGKDGWLGPDTDRSDIWSRIPFMMALAQYHESLPQGAGRLRCESVAYRFFDALTRRLDEGVTLQTWSSMRIHDLIWSVHYFVDALPPGSHLAKWMLDLAARLHRDGFNWNEGWFNSSSFATRPVLDPATMETHGVNNAQAVKRGAVWARQSGNFALGFAESWLAWSQLRRFHGQPSGAFSADEHLGGRLPSRGTELCTVVESMWSLLLTAQMAPTDQEALKALDAVEALAFNALPGSLSDDLWSHPYLQMANSYQALFGEDVHVWVHDGPNAAMYGLEPNYPCCTSNFHQGYPKFASSLFFEEEENRLISAIWAPSKVRSSVAEVELRTEYPFDTSLEYWVQNAEPFVLKVRLPLFLREAPESLRVWLHEDVVQTAADGFLLFHISAASTKSRLAARLSWAAKARVQSSPQQGASVYVGPLLMALDLKETRTKRDQLAFSAANWDTRASLPWQMALPRQPQLDPVVWSSIGPRPFQRGRCPLSVSARLAPLTIEQWPVLSNAPGPVLPVEEDLLEVERTLVPYACTSIRISAFPVAQPNTLLA